MTVAVLNPAAAEPMASPLPGPHAVLTEGLTKRYGREVALEGVNLQAPRGSVYVLAGANGAGKSTLLRTLMNLSAPNAGRTEVLGLDPRRHGARVRAQVGYVPEGVETGYRWMTAGRLLDHLSAYYPSWDQAYAERLSRLLDVRPERRIGRLSKGQSRRLQLVAALAHRPPLLLLDEPTDGLDPVARDEVLGLLSEHLADTGCTILVSTHLVYEVERVAEHLGVLRDGRLVAQAPLDRLHARLRSYRLEAPEGWTAPPDLADRALHRSGPGRELRWTIWGDQPEVTARLAGAGAVVRDVAPLGLDEAVVTLLRHRTSS
ncbi:MAG TPA: ABC transporter ATP-binding protein [Caulobacteraceae bacterium]|nr:ABC transporter ATP-binding protein [Caulobacteraceae bacterium]